MVFLLLYYYLSSKTSRMIFIFTINVFMFIILYIFIIYYLNNVVWTRKIQNIDDIQHLKLILLKLLYIIIMSTYIIIYNIYRYNTYIKNYMFICKDEWYIDVLNITVFSIFWNLVIIFIFIYYFLCFYYVLCV